MENYESLLKSFKKLIPLETIETASDDRFETPGKLPLDSESVKSFLTLIHSANLMASEMNRKHINTYKKEVEQLVKEALENPDFDITYFMGTLQTYAYCCGVYNGSVKAYNSIYDGLVKTCEHNDLEI